MGGGIGQGRVGWGQPQGDSLRNRWAVGSVDHRLSGPRAKKHARLRDWGRVGYCPRMWPVFGIFPTPTPPLYCLTWLEYRPMTPRRACKNIGPTFCAGCDSGGGTRCAQGGAGYVRVLRRQALAEALVLEPPVLQLLLEVRADLLQLGGGGLGSRLGVSRGTGEGGEGPGGGPVDSDDRTSLGHQGALYTGAAEGSKPAGDPEKNIYV